MRAATVLFKAESAESLQRLIEDFLVKFFREYDLRSVWSGPTPDREAVHFAIFVLKPEFLSQPPEKKGFPKK